MLCRLITLLVWLCSSLHAQNCNYKDDCFEYDFGACSNSALDVTANVTEDDLLKLTLLNPEIYGNDSDWHSLLYSSLLYLFCSESQPPEADLVGPPYCLVEWSVNDLVEEEGVCETCNCTVVMFSVLDLWRGSEVASSSVADFLNQQIVRAALQLAGFTVISASSNQANSLGLFDVPVASWACVGVGVLLASFVLLQPLWWNKLFARTRSGESIKEPENT